MQPDRAQAVRVRQTGGAGRRGGRADLHHHRRLRRHFDGARGDAGFAGQSRGHRRLGRAGHACRAVRRHGLDRRLRQVPARDDDGGGAAQPAIGVPLRRVEPARAGTPGATSRSSTCSRASAPARKGASTMPSSSPSSRRRVPGPAPVPGCSPPTPWPASARPWGCRFREAPRCPPSTTGSTNTPSASGEAVMGMLDAGIRPRHILTREAFENAITTVMALGGSTNAVLHLLAIAARGRGAADARGLRPDQPPHPAPGRPQAVRPIPHGRSRPDRRGPGGAADAARRRAAPWRPGRP